jgi:hypothetical protein
VLAVPEDPFPFPTGEARAEDAARYLGPDFFREESYEVGRAVPRDDAEVQAIATLSQSNPDGFRLALSGEGSDLGRKLLSLGILDVQGHHPPPRIDWCNYTLKV